MILNILSLIAMGLLATFGSYFLKRATAVGLSPRALIVSPYLWLGGVLYVLSALLNIYLLLRLPYSVVVPLGALTYVWTLLVARWLLKEPITKLKLAGLGLILAGLVCVVLG